MSAREIKAKINSINNTSKITKAMETIATSKMRKAMLQMAALKPYAEKIRDVIAHLGAAHPEYPHPYLHVRDIKRVGYVIVGTDRGLCGGLNVNLFRTVVSHMKEQHQAGREIEVCSIGLKTQSFFKNIRAKIVMHKDHIGDAPSMASLVGVIKVMLDAYADGSIDALYIVSNTFVNMMTQRPQLIQLLPITPKDGARRSGHWDYIYEPEAKTILDLLLKRYVESQVYQGVVENIACEQAAKMIAMKNATDNANKIIDELKQAYNKARQAAITQELSEIVAGAAEVG